MGAVADHDRTFRARVVSEESTAKEGVHFTLSDGVMKQGEYWSYLPVTINRTADMKEETLTITLELIPTDDLKANVKDGTVFTLNVADYLLRPANWQQYYFGNYSANKYKFMIEVLGITDYPMTGRNDPELIEGTYSSSQIETFSKQCADAYREYRRDHGPIWEDDNAENKVEISFPTS